MFTALAWKSGCSRKRSSGARRSTSLDQQFGRSMQRDKALSPEPPVAYAHNDEPLLPAPGLPRASDRARLVRRGQRQVAVVYHRAAGSVSRQGPGPLVPHREGRDGERRDEVAGKRRHPPAAQVVCRADHQGRRHPQGGWRGDERRHRRSSRSRSRSTKARGSRPRGTSRTPSTRGSCSTTTGRAPRQASTRLCRASPTRTARCSPPRRSSRTRSRASSTTCSIRAG